MVLEVQKEENNEEKKNKLINIILKEQILGKKFKTFLSNFMSSNSKTLSTRIKIDTGFRCNAKCNYCYYISRINDKFIESDDIYAQIDYASNNGFKSIEFSGGESTIHPNFSKFIKYAKDKNLIVSVITNGYFDTNFLEEIKDIDEIMFSIHGYKKSHDSVVKLENAYENILKNCNYILKNLSINIRFNIIINKNILELDNIIDTILNLNSKTISKIAQINFLPINEWRDAKKVGTYYQNTVHANIKIIEKNIDKIIDKNIEFFIRYFEYCKIDKKYHKYVYNYLDHYFSNDWNPFFVLKEDIEIDYSKILKNPIEAISKKLYTQRSTQYHKTKECLTCEYNYICDGFKKINK